MTVGNVEQPPEPAIALPDPDGFVPALLWLSVPHEDINDLVANCPDPLRDPGVWHPLARCVRALVRGMGAARGPLPWPAPPHGHPFFYVYVFLAALRHVRAYHERRGIPAEISRLTLADLGRHLAVHRLRYGAAGLGEYQWLTLHFRGGIYQLGRLQFEPVRLGNRTGTGVAAAGMPFGPGDPALGVHVPQFHGQLAPSACDAAFAQAAEFFPRHFPEQPYRIGVCHSWLLDPCLGEYLPAESNIMRFQRRFRTAYTPTEPMDESTLRFVFGAIPSTLDELPRRSTLERAIADHLRAGRHWYGRAGWLEL
jgi:hypothetical protein